MQFHITDDEVNQYCQALSIVRDSESHVPGNLVMHKVLLLLDVPKVLSHQASFKNEVFVDERLVLDLFQANNMIEYKVTSGRQLKVAGTIHLK